MSLTPAIGRELELQTINISSGEEQREIVIYGENVQKKYVYLQEKHILPIKEKIKLLSGKIQQQQENLQKMQPTLYELNSRVQELTKLSTLLEKNNHLVTKQKVLRGVLYGSGILLCTAVVAAAIALTILALPIMGQCPTGALALVGPTMAAAGAVSVGYVCGINIFCLYGDLVKRKVQIDAKKQIAKNKQNAEVKKNRSTRLDLVSFQRQLATETEFLTKLRFVKLES